MNDKIINLRNKLNENGLDQLIVTGFYNLYYFAGIKIYTGERLLALLVDREREPLLFVNELFSAPESENYRVIYYNDTEDPFTKIREHLRGSRIAVDGSWTASFLFRLMKCYDGEFVDGSALMANIRVIKTEEEQKLMQKASLDNDEVMSRIKPFLKVGLTEKQVYDRLLEIFEEVTHEPVSFYPIIAFGANAADPHHGTDDTVLKPGQQVLIDMGSHYQGYCSDMTRTFLQENDPLTEEIYDIVLKANLAAEAAVRPGVRFCDVDRAARKVIEDAGYGPYFTHRTGHGIGLEVHEPYDVSSSDELIIQEGMCFSIEPGIYLPGKTGVRIEDLVICGKDGAIVLNHYSKEKQYF